MTSILEDIEKGKINEILYTNISEVMDLRNTNFYSKASVDKNIVGVLSFFNYPLIQNNYYQKSNKNILVSSDARDAGKFMVNSIKQLKKSSSNVFISPKESRYYFGWNLSKDNNIKIARTKYASGGFESRIILWPEESNGLAIMSSQNSLLLSYFAFPSIEDATRKILVNGYSNKLFPLQRLYLLLSISAIVQILASSFQITRSVSWAKSVRDKAASLGKNFPIIFGIIRNFIGIVLRMILVIFIPSIFKIFFAEDIQWREIIDKEPGLIAWIMAVTMLITIRNISRLVWLSKQGGEFFNSSQNSL